MNIRSLFYLSLAVLATTVIPGIHASQAQTPEINIPMTLGTEPNAQLLTFHSEISAAILAKLLGATPDKLGTAIPEDKHEAIKVLHAIELNKLTPKEYAEVRKIYSGTDMDPKRVLTNDAWQSTKRALDTIQASSASYISLQQATRQVFEDKDTTEATKNALEAFYVPCFYRTSEVDASSSAQQETESVFAQELKRDQEALAWTKKLAEPTVTQETLNAVDKFLGSAPIAAGNINRDILADLLKALQKAKKRLEAQKTEQAVKAVLHTQEPTHVISQPAPVPTPAPEASNQAKLDKKAAEWNNRLFSPNLAQEPLKDTIEKAEQFLNDNEAHLSASAAGVLKANIRTARRYLPATDDTHKPASTAQPAPAPVKPAAATVTPPAPAQPSPKLPATKSFFSAHPWVKYGTYLLAGAAVVYGGYRLYKHVNVNKLARTARLWA